VLDRRPDLEALMKTLSVALNGVSDPYAIDEREAIRAEGSSEESGEPVPPRDSRGTHR
jgi:hypothetical protein